MIALFGLFAEVERDPISERTKEGLAAAKAQGGLRKIQARWKFMVRQVRNCTPLAVRHSILAMMLYSYRSISVGKRELRSSISMLT